MKKIYTLLFLTTYAVSTVCMNEQPSSFVKTSADRQQKINTTNYLQLFTINPHENFTEIPLASINQTHTNIQCTANQQGWQQLNAIANIRYTDNQQPIQSSNKNNTTSTKQHMIIQETKYDTNLMQRLYDNAYRFVEYERTTEKPVKHDQHKNLILLIDAMNKAKNNGINEDMAGKFAYKKYDQDTISCYIPLVFSCLKKYTQTINNTKETLPNINTFCDKKLAQALNVLSIDFSTINTPDSLSDSHPAYLNLISKLKAFVKNDITGEDSNIRYLTAYLYSNEKILLSTIYKDGSYINLTDEFYQKAYPLLILNGNTRDIYNLLQIIKRAKEKGAIKKETELGYNILRHEPSQQGFTDVFDYLKSLIPNTKMNPINTPAKNRIALFCKLVEKYNNAQPNKKRPIPSLFFAYNEQKKMNIAFPDSFNNSLFNDNCYAFTEFEQLREDTITLMKSDDKSIQLLVDELYPTKK